MTLIHEDEEALIEIATRMVRIAERIADATVCCPHHPSVRCRCEGFQDQPVYADLYFALLGTLHRAWIGTPNATDIDLALAVMTLEEVEREPALAKTLQIIAGRSAHASPRSVVRRMLFGPLPADSEPGRYCPVLWDDRLT